MGPCKRIEFAAHGGTCLFIACPQLSYPPSFVGYLQIIITSFHMERCSKIISNQIEQMMMTIITYSVESHKLNLGRVKYMHILPLPHGDRKIVSGKPSFQKSSL